MRKLHLVLVVAVSSALSLAGGATGDPSSEDQLQEHVTAIVTPSKAGGEAGGGARTREVEVLAHAYPGTGTNADVYAHRGYAYLGSWVGRGCLSSGVRVFDLQDPSSPQLVSTFADAASEPDVARTWTEKVIVERVNTPAFRGDLAVVSFQACGRAGRLDPTVFRGFGLYDVTDPAAPHRLALYATEPGVNGGSHEIWLERVGRRAYVYTAIPNSELRTSPDGVTPGLPDFRIIDVSDPANPVQAGEWGAWRELGVHPTSGQGDFESTFVHSVRVDERAQRAYLSYWDLGTVILDISDPSHPVYLGRTSFGPDEQGDAHSTWVTPNGKLLIETHETEAGVPTFYDISDPANPVRLSDFYVEGYETDTVHDPKARGNLAAFSWYSLGVVFADISNPSDPRFLAQFVPETDIVNPDFFCVPDESCAQVWGVFLHRGYVLASDMNSGLWVLKLK